ncbi:MAG: polysaccharide biosynthesis protein [Gammaproteobacteria bacterium]|nr:MAG: polysaccharide biosynthesis protein [Gammaproteobacteria bacterium]TND04506.1 MAG: polysaccharide biosynthesis protein [Gammaproteobacteria bacterium]
MPILLSVNNYYYPRGGAEVVFLEHNKLFEHSGWQVIPFAMHHPKNIETPWSEYFVDEIEYGEQYNILGKLRRVPKTIYSLEARRNLSRLLTRARPDICHLHNIYHHISPSILGLLKRNGVPVVLTLHDLKLACPAYKMLTHDGICERCKGGRVYNVVVHRCVKQSYALSTLVAIETILHSLLGSYSKYVDRFVVPSRFHLEKMVEWGWDRSRFKYIPNFIDTHSFSPEYRPGKTFVYFGRLNSEKGVATLIKAAAIAGAALQIVGVGPEEAALRKLAENMKAKVDFLGYLRGDALHEVVRLSRAVVLPSELYENAPLTVMEGYALGKPVIGASIGGIPELIHEGKSGATFESGSVEGLAAVLAEFSAYKDTQISDMGRYGRSWMEREFSEKHYLGRMLEIYRELGVAGARS